MASKQEADKLIVKTFGNFSLSYNGQVITGKNKNSESQFSSLMQILLHAGEKGVERETLEESLFKNRDLHNIHHTTQSVIYNAKKRLKEFDLPDVNYIYQRGGVYYWTDKIPVEEDARLFEQYVVEARSIRDDAESIPVYMKAIHLYTGDFLESQLSSSWIARENWRYRSIFTEAVRECAARLRRNDEYEMLVDLGNYATQVQPFSDWETLTMEGYVFLKRYKEAEDLYAKTIDLYLEEQGIRPSSKMNDLINKLGEQLEFPHEMLEDIQDRLSEEDEDLGGYVCSYPVFVGIYQSMSRFLERSGTPVFLMLCSIVDSKGNVLGEGKKLNELSERLGDAIQKSVRRSDIINRYSKSQYLILLTNTTRKNCEIVQKRINKSFMINRQRIHVKYYVNNVLV